MDFHTNKRGSSRVYLNAELLGFARRLGGSPMRFLRLFERALRVIERLHRQFVRGEVIFLSMMRGRDPVSMCGPLVHLGGYLM